MTRIRRIYTDKTMIMLLNKSVFLIIFCSLLVLLAEAQPTPGKEKIVIRFPTEYRWKSKKIPKDTKAIRGFEYIVQGKDTENAPVKTVTVTTIDRRYYPMKAEGSPEEKWEYEKADCPEATLEIVDKRTTEGRTAILYAIKGIRPSGGGCGEGILLTYVAEGPTAFHTMELTIPETRFTPELYEQWCNVLLQSRIE